MDNQNYNKNDFDNQIKLVKDLKEKMYNNKILIKELENKIEIEEKKLQNLCTDHDFIAEDNNDYHRSGYYYICSKCNYMTTCKPFKYRMK